MAFRKYDWLGETQRHVQVAALLIFVITVFRVGVAPAQADLGPENVLILVNSNSPTSRYIARMYRQYYPAIQAWQVLELSGLTDCSGPASTPADEIITRDVYRNSIASPVRQYLLSDPDRLSQIMVLITTAGIPYRIEDTYSSYANAIYPAGSNPSIVGAHEDAIDAASVESELTCLWYSNWGTNPFGLANRMVNPYQAYRNSSRSLFQESIPDATDLSWFYAASTSSGLASPRTEGQFTPWFGTVNRHFNVGRMLLTARLDGPKEQGQSAIFVVREMLERARRVSDPQWGLAPAFTYGVIDDAPNSPVGDIDNNRVFNLHGYMSLPGFPPGPNGETSGGPDYWEFDPNTNQPPDAFGVRLKDDFSSAYFAMTGQDPVNDTLNSAPMPTAWGTRVVQDRRGGVRTNQLDMKTLNGTDPNTSDPLLIFLASYGVNGDEGNNASYLLDQLQSNEESLELANGAIFISFESFNAVTMFSGVDTQPVKQGKIIDFIRIGGAGAIGHAFEPQSDAVIDTEFFFYNYLADHDQDGQADLTFVEAAFTGIPYLSWAEVVLGDPLMRPRFNPSAANRNKHKAWERLEGDVNRDGQVNLADIWWIRNGLGGLLNSADDESFEKYDDRCDLNQDGQVNLYDLWVARNKVGE